jgi:hypothetical protein
LTGEDPGQRHRPVEEIGAAGLAGPLGGPLDVEHVIEELERKADPRAKCAH